MTTLLGSCVAITLWHPAKHLVGMCHFVLPRRPEGTTPGKPGPDARYALDCIGIFKAAAEQRGSRLCDYQGRIFGGGNMLASAAAPPATGLAEVDPVGDINSAAAFSGLTAEGVRIMEADVGEQGYRRVWFYPHTGEVQVTFVAVSASSGI